jgi:hypothetical protein
VYLNQQPLEVFSRYIQEGIDSKEAGGILLGHVRGEHLELLKQPSLLFGTGASGFFRVHAFLSSSPGNEALEGKQRSDAMHRGVAHAFPGSSNAFLNRPEGVADAGGWSSRRPAAARTHRGLSRFTR